jgi:hypothetical protein
MEWMVGTHLADKERLQRREVRKPASTHEIQNLKKRVFYVQLFRSPLKNKINYSFSITKKCVFRLWKMLAKSLVISATVLLAALAAPIPYSQTRIARFYDKYCTDLSHRGEKECIEHELKLKREIEGNRIIINQ